MKKSIIEELKTLKKDEITIYKGATEKQISAVEKHFNLILPKEYKEILLWSNGLIVCTDACYLDLYKVNEIIELNKDYEVKEFLETDKAILIGTDGGGEGLLLDFRKSKEPRLVIIPLGDLDFEVEVLVGNTFEKGFIKALENGLFD